MGKGKEKLSCWFSLSYAGWLTLPRVMMEDMPDEWQSKMADLLNEYDETFVNQPKLTSYVQVREEGRFTRTPKELLNYRHPDKEYLKAMKNLK